jgi:hypothetical protein
MVIIPPEVDPQTDEEDIDDDYIQEKGAVLPYDVPGQIEIQWSHSDSEAEESDEDYDIPLSVLQKRCGKRGAPNNNNAAPPTKKKTLPEPK